MPPIHSAENVSLPERPTQQETTASLRSPRLLQEIAALEQEGYVIAVGETQDRAYDNPEKIMEVYNRLEGAGAEFSREAGRILFGAVGLVKSLEHTSLPVLGSVRRRIRAQLREARAAILYDQPDVKAMDWHLQNGKALALGTIMDAHDLYTPETGGVHPAISGGLPLNFMDHPFPVASSDNIVGKTASDALVATLQEFRGMNEERAHDKAQRECIAVERFLTTPSQQGFKEIVQYCTDSLGIRSRKEEVRTEINRHVEASPNESFLMMSVGCGTAQPMLEVMQDICQKGRAARLILIDQDPVALAAAVAYADTLGLKDAIEVHCAKLFVKDGVRLTVMQLEAVLKGRQVDVAEDSGLREYFPDAMYKDLTKQVWDSLADDGIMVTGNMNKNRPQADFLHGLMGWPIKVQMRHMKDTVALHRQAGVPRGAIRIQVTQDGVYTHVFSSKQPVQ